MQELETRALTRPMDLPTPAAAAPAPVPGHAGPSDGEDELKIDPKELLIVKDGTIKVAHPYKEPEPQYDANGELIKASGTWTQVEHDRFLKAIAMYPKGPWKAIAAMVGSRTVRQTQTHAQKYREKLARRIRGLRNRNGTLQSPPMQYAHMIPTTTSMYGPVLLSPSAGYHHHQQQQQPQQRPQSLGMASVDYLHSMSPTVASSPSHGMVPPHRPTLPSDIYYASNYLYQPPPVITPQSVTMDLDAPYTTKSPAATAASLVMAGGNSASWYAQSTASSVPTPTAASSSVASSSSASPTVAGTLPSASLSLAHGTEFNESMEFFMHLYADNGPAQVASMTQ